MHYIIRRNEKKIFNIKNKFRIKFLINILKYFNCFYKNFNSI